MADSANEKDLVKSAYDQIAQKYLDWSLENIGPRLKYTDLLISHLPAHASVLELGCGAGKPILERLSQHADKLYGNDISDAQLALAKQNCPHATMLPGDMIALDFEPGTLDGVVSFFAIFHLPRDEQSVMLSKLFAWLKPGGVVTLSTSAEDMPALRQRFLGAQVFWSSWGVEGYRKTMLDIGFEVLKEETLSGAPDDAGPDHPDHGLLFLWMLLRKPSAA